MKCALSGFYGGDGVHTDGKQQFKLIPTSIYKGHFNQMARLSNNKLHPNIVIAQRNNIFRTQKMKYKQLNRNCNQFFYVASVNYFMF